MGVGVDVWVGVAVGVCVELAAGVCVIVGVNVGVCVGVGVCVEVSVIVGVSVGVIVCVGVGVKVTLGLRSTLKQLTICEAPYIIYGVVALSVKLYGLPESMFQISFPLPQIKILLLLTKRP